MDGIRHLHLTTLREDIVSQLGDIERPASEGRPKLQTDIWSKDKPSGTQVNVEGNWQGISDNNQGAINDKEQPSGKPVYGTLRVHVNAHQ